MQRRVFLQSLSAVIAAPALPLGAMTIATPAAVPKVSVAQQLWASYFKTAKGQQALASVQSATSLPTAQAKALVMRSVAQARAPLSVVAKAAAVNNARVARTAFKAPKLPDVQTFLRRAVPNLREDILCNCADTRPYTERTDREPTSSS